MHRHRFPDAPSNIHNFSTLWPFSAVPTSPSTFSGSVCPSLCIPFLHSPYFPLVPQPLRPQTFILHIPSSCSLFFRQAFIPHLPTHTLSHPTLPHSPTLNSSLPIPSFPHPPSPIFPQRIIHTVHPTCTLDPYIYITRPQPYIPLYDV